MPLHLVKLCVGVETIEDLQDWIRRRAGRAGVDPAEHVHVTRMVPQRRDALLDGGSLYWVIRGAVQVRQRLIDLRPFVDEEGVRRCAVVMEPTLVATRRQPKRPFQGWRYLDAAAAPADLPTGAADDLPPALRAELAALGLL